MTIGATWHLFFRSHSFDVIAQNRALSTGVGEEHLNEVAIIDNVNSRCNNIKIPVYLANIIIGLGVLDSRRSAPAFPEARTGLLRNSPH